jgi:hypothetical protein
MIPSTTKKQIPKILLIGAGRFGLNHIKTLKELESKKIIQFVGVVIRNNDHRKKIENEFNIKTFEKITTRLLLEVDAVDIATPPESHFKLIKQCLPLTNVFVEKPMTSCYLDAKKVEKIVSQHKNILTVGHIFRYHPITKKLKELLGKKNMPRKITGVFINPAALDQGREPAFEFLHLFDVVDEIWGKDPMIVSGTTDNRVSTINIRYNEQEDARFTLGCRGDKKERTLKFKYADFTIDADFILNTITQKKGKMSKVLQCPQKEELLYKELSDFILTISGKKENTLNATTATRIISIAERSLPKIKKIPSVAIIGGGIFGTSIAAEIAEFCSVTIFEKNNDILQEGAFVNCFRHHHGYHYPRSSETVIDIQNSREDFEKVYKKAIISSHNTYYGLAKNGSFVSTKEFLTFCKKHNLEYKKEFPASNLLSKKEMALSVKVPETSYHYEILKKITVERLDKAKNIKILTNSIVKNCTLEKSGIKKVTYVTGKQKQKIEKFDFVINATYANINNMTTWLSFEKCPVRIDLAEELVIKLNTPPISITIIDGPFATLMPTGNKHEFILYHVTESILDRYVPLDGLIKKEWERKSNKDAIVKESLKFFPILKDVEVLESRIVHRGVQAYHEHDDSRVVDLIDHGFGCFSILSGKILSSVTTGKRISDIIKKTTHQ